MTDKKIKRLSVENGNLHVIEEDDTHMVYEDVEFVDHTHTCNDEKIMKVKDIKLPTLYKIR